MPENHNESVWPGDLLERLRVAADLNRTELAAATGVTEQTVRVWETGATAPRVDQLRKAVALIRSRGVEVLAEDFLGTATAEAA